MELVDYLNLERICLRQILRSMVDTTSEVPLTNFHRGDIIDSKDLPLRYTTIQIVSGRGRPRKGYKD